MTQSVEKRCLARPAWTHNCDHLCWLNKAGLIKKYFLVTLSIVFYYLWVRNSTKTRVLALTPLSLVKRHDVRDASPFKQHLVMLLNWFITNFLGEFSGAQNIEIIAQKNRVYSQNIGVIA